MLWGFATLRLWGFRFLLWDFGVVVPYGLSDLGFARVRTSRQALLRYGIGFYDPIALSGFRVLLFHGLMVSGLWGLGLSEIYNLGAFAKVVP